MGMGHKRLEPLKLLDLQKCNTVNDIVTGMSKCSFGARMLGEVADTLTSMIQSRHKPVLIYDGKPDTPLGRLLRDMHKKDWFSRALTPEGFSQQHISGTNLVVVGPYSERHEDGLYNGNRTIFINQFDLAKPGQVRDGYFPDAVFADPRFVMPVLNCVLEERLEGHKETLTDFVEELDRYGGVAEQVFNGAETFRQMVADKDCTVFLTLSGAMTIAQMGLVICDMIDNEMVDYIASTGALMAHGLVESMGLKHYKHNPRHDDKMLARRKLNRVTDTLEPETNFDHIDEVVDAVLKTYSGSKPVGPSQFHRDIGAYLAKKFPHERGILKSAYEKGVPVLVPAFHDSEIGNDAYVHNLWRKLHGRKPIVFNQELDTEILMKMATGSKRMGIFSVGGGVPRNFTQNVAPLIEIANGRLNLKLKTAQFFYGNKISPDKMHYGHLSGCTYDEGKSWRKMDLNGSFNSIQADATQTWPFIVKYVMDSKHTL